MMPFHWHHLVRGMIIIVTASLAACGTQNTHLGEIRESDLVGVWRADYVNVSAVDNATNQIIKVTGVETLTLAANGTYEQIYNDGYGYVYKGGWQPWHLDPEKLIHLTSGRWYPSGISNAEGYAEDGGISVVLRGKRIYLDLDQEILLVVFVERRGELFLQHLPAFDPDSGGVTFHRISSVTAEITLTATP
jgi:hypothetical protein